MIVARKTRCTLEAIQWISPSSLFVQFRPHKRFRYAPGQFLALIIPSTKRHTKPVKRLYSLASAPDTAYSTGLYELVVRYVDGGVGSDFLARSAPGDKFDIVAPYGDFFYRPPLETRNTVLVGTGSGLAPLRSIVTSQLFKKHPPERTLCLLGVRHESEALFERDFVQAGVELMYAVSQPRNGYRGFKGRVTELLASPPKDWFWHGCDFYLCGNGDMIHQALRILRGMGVADKHIHREAFTVTSSRAATARPANTKKDNKAA